jgi:cell division protein FtsA
MQNIVVGIDIGSQTTRVVVAEHVPGRERPLVLGVGSAPSQGMRHGYITNQSLATESVRSALIQAERFTKIGIKKVYIALNGVSVSSEIVTTSVVVGRADSEVTHLDLDKASGQAHETLLKAKRNVRIVHAIPLQYLLDGQEVLGQPIGMRGTKLEMQVLFVTVLEHHFDALVDTVTKAGVEIVDIIAAPLASSMPIMSQRHKMVGSLLLDIGSETVSMTIFENEAIIDLHVFPIGSSDITNDLALGFQVNLDEAEEIKHNDDTGVPKKKREEIIEARLSDIFELITKHLKKLHRNGLLPAGVLITGGGASLAGLEDFAKNELQLPVRVVNEKDVEKITQRKLKDQSWLTAYGLCFLDNKRRGQYEESPFGSFFKNIKRSMQSFGEQFLP